MADKIALENDSKARVAYDLLNKIANQEANSQDGKFLKPDPRTYYLTLFKQCVEACEPQYSLDTIFETGRGSGTS